jgi:hypothetical protein
MFGDDDKDPLHRPSVNDDADVLLLTRRFMHTFLMHDFMLFMAPMFFLIALVSHTSPTLNDYD